MKIAIVLAAYCVSWCFATSVFSHCGDWPGRDLVAPRMLRFSGKYSNPNWGYSVIIPSGLIGYSDPPPQPYHGFGTVLSWEPRSYIYVSADLNSALYESLTDVETQYLGRLEKESSQVLSVDHFVSKLDSLPAKRYVATNTCSDPNTVFVNDYVFALSKDKGVLYSVALLTTKERYAKDKRFLDQIVTSWKLIPEEK